MTGKGQEVTLILFLGLMGRTEVERMVSEAQQAIATDLVQRAHDSQAFGQIIVATNSPALARKLEGIARIDLNQGPFHFGQRLRELIRRYQIERPFYIGGGSLPLLSSLELANIAQQLASSERTFISNNFFSADLVAFGPGQAIEAIDPPNSDNALPQLLLRQAGLKRLDLPRTAATQFDVDTPTDLLILKLHPRVGPCTRDYLNRLELDTSRLELVLRFFTDPLAEVLLAGRVGSYVWSVVEQEAACRLRVLSEERGMRADGREDREEVHTILGFYLQQVGPRPFFQALAKLGNAALIDSRVIFNHLRRRPSRQDRFLSDLGRVEGIADPLVRDFTQAAVESPQPVVLGGHSLVAGGLLALVEAARHKHSSAADSKPD